jgi:hypothetical protein
MQDWVEFRDDGGIGVLGGPGAGSFDGNNPSQWQTGVLIPAFSFWGILKRKSDLDWDHRGSA